MRDGQSTIQVDETTKQVFEEFQSIIHQQFNSALYDVVESELSEKLKSILQQMESSNDSIERLINNYEANVNGIVTYFENDAEQVKSLLEIISWVKQNSIESTDLLSKTANNLNEKISNVIEIVAKFNRVQDDLYTTLTAHKTDIMNSIENAGNSTRQFIDRLFNGLLTEKKVTDEIINSISSKVSEHMKTIEGLAVLVSGNQIESLIQFQNITLAQSSISDGLKTLGSLQKDMLTTLQNSDLDIIATLQKSGDKIIEVQESSQKQTEQMMQKTQSQLDEIKIIQQQIVSWQKLPWYKKIFVRS